MTKRKLGASAPGFSALKKRYRLQAGKLALLNVKSGRTQYETYIRAYRREASLAKKAGLISKSTDIRKLKVNAQSSRAIGIAEDYIQGKSRFQKISKPLQKQLKDEGYSVYNGKVKLAKGSRINNRGELVIGKGQKSKVSYVIQAGLDVEKQVSDILNSLPEGFFVVIPLPGGNFSQVFSARSFKSFGNVVNKYLGGDAKHGSLTYVYVQTIDDYQDVLKFEDKRSDFLVKRSEIIKQRKRQEKSEAKIAAKKKKINRVKKNKAKKK